MAGSADPPEKAKGVARRRAVEPADRRKAILDAALDVFAERGFAAARLEDVAARAGIAKGTIYLYFADKRALFMELARGAAAPMLERMAALAAIDAPMAQVLPVMADLFREQVLGTRRKEILRLIIAEGVRFPELAEFHHREIISRAIPLLRGMLERAHARGEIASDASARFPQLVMAPLILCVLWDALFGAIEPLDTGALLAAHIELLTGGKGKIP